MGMGFLNSHYGEGGITMKMEKLALMAMILSLSFSGASHAANNINWVRANEQLAPMTTPTAKLVYYGGPVISNVQINSVFWGANVDATVKAKISGFYKTLVVSTYMDWIKEYNTTVKSDSGAPGTNQTIGRGTFGGEFLITPFNTSATIDDADVRIELQKQVDAGQLPKPTDNSLYMIHFPKGLTITMQGYKSCQDFCAYHNSFHTTTQQNLYYSVMPDFTDGICPQGCGSHDVFGNFTSAASHEVIEAITDCQVGDAVAAAAPLAWYDNANGEIGDICNQVAGSITASDSTKYVVQGQWSNKRNSCVWAP
jgi:hypothetical protein